MRMRSSHFTRVTCLFGAGDLVLCAIELSVCQSSSVPDLKVGNCVMLPHGDEIVAIKHASRSELHEAEVSTLVDTDPKDASVLSPSEEALAL